MIVLDSHIFEIDREFGWRKKTPKIGWKQIYRLIYLK